MHVCKACLTVKDNNNRICIDRFLFIKGENMKKVILVVTLSIIASPAFAQKSCEALKDEITKKVESKHVKNYQLDIVDKDEVKDQKVVGSCDLGRKRILYTKN